MSVGNRLKIAICGKSGLVGSKLEKFFLSKGSDVVGVKIRDEISVSDIAKQIENCDVLINLSGVTILGRWDDEYKKRLYSSRIDTTKKLVDAIGLCKEKPKLFLNASAVGIYDSFHSHKDGSQKYADDFLSHLCRDWEAEARRSGDFGVRNVQMRFGVIYAKDGGAMQKMLPPFRFALGGVVGSGEQIISWIHLEDLLRAVEFIMKTPDINGAINFSAPYPISNKKQTQIMGKILHRPTIFPLPAFVVKLIFGDGSTVLLDSKEVYPSKLLESGFVFEYGDFEDALQEIVS